MEFATATEVMYVHVSSLGAINLSAHFISRRDKPLKFLKPLE